MGILAVILGILALLCAVLGTMLFGTMGCIISVVLAAAAIVLAILNRNRKQKGGIGTIVVSAIALITAFTMNGMWSSGFKAAHEKAVTLKPDGLWAQVSEDTSGGLMGIIQRLPKDEASLNALNEELDELNRLEEAQKQQQ